jgi:tRNA modification GTPase
VEKQGIARTWDAAAKADMAILLIDAQHGVGEQETEILGRLGEIPVLTVHNKIDVVGEPPRVSENGLELWLSALTGTGIDLLRSRLLSVVGWSSTGEGTFIARARHLTALHRARDHLQIASESGNRLELFAEELRLAQESLAEITGEYSADDLLGAIFGQFCIGK